MCGPLVASRVVFFCHFFQKKKRKWSRLFGKQAETPAGFSHTSGREVGRSGLQALPYLGGPGCDPGSRPSSMVLALWGQLLESWCGRFERGL